MPDPALQQAIKEAYAVAPSQSLILSTLEFRHPSFTVPIRVVLDHVDLSATLELGAPLNPGETVNFIAGAFTFSLPEVSDTAGPEMTISIDNVTSEIEENIAAANLGTGSIEVTYRAYLDSDLTGPQNDPPLHMEVKTIKATDTTVEARCTFGNFANRRFPREIYNTARFPSLGK